MDLSLAGQMTSLVSKPVYYFVSILVHSAYLNLFKNVEGFFPFVVILNVLVHHVYCTYVCISDEYSMLRDQKRASGPLELELEMAVSCLPCECWELNLDPLQEQPLLPSV